MKYLLLISAITLFSFTPTSEVTDLIGLEGPIEFNKTNFYLAWTDKPNDNYIIQEYLPKGESLEKFNQMFTSHLFLTKISVEDAVKQKLKELQTRKKTDKTCNYKVSESPDGKEVIVDFILGESDGDKMTIVEFNVYRYKKIKLDKKRTAIHVLAYSKRAYGDEITPFFKSLGSDRAKHLNELIGFPYPSIVVK